MPAEAGLALAGAGFLVTGTAVLLALGVARRTVAGVVAAGGLAYLTGIAAIGLAAIALLVLGGPLTVASTAAIMVAITAAAVAVVVVRGRREPRERSDPLPPWDRVAIGAFAVLLAVYAVVGLDAALGIPLSEWDGWTVWARKALLLTEHEQLPVAFLSSWSGRPFLPDYPLLLPVVEATGFDFAGASDTRWVAGICFSVLIAGAWALAFLGSRVGRPVIAVPIALAVAVAGAFTRESFTGYADVPVAIFLAVGALVLFEGLFRERRGEVAAGVLMLAGAASLKNEGLVTAVAVLVAAVIVMAARQDRRRLAWSLAAAAGVAVLVAPWRVWLLAQGIESYLRPERLLEPGLMADRADRVPPAIEALWTQLDNGRWVPAVAVALSLAFVTLVVRRERTVAALYLVAGVVAFGGLVVAYWLSPIPIEYHLMTSASRVVMLLVALAAAATLHLAGALGRSPPVARGPYRRAANVRRRRRPAVPA